jgi:hypothetical protein
MRETATVMFIGGASSSMDYVGTEIFINGRVPTHSEAIQSFMYGSMFTGALMAFAPVAGFIRRQLALKNQPKDFRCRGENTRGDSFQITE